eukprot:398598-Ditylum_brightwellii.AAC.1
MVDDCFKMWGQAKKSRDTKLDDAKKIYKTSRKQYSPQELNADLGSEDEANIIDRFKALSLSSDNSSDDNKQKLNC